MRAGANQFVSIVAGAAVALHTMLWVAATPLVTGPATDPFSVICHSGAPTPVGQTSDHGAPAPAHACDHCNVCSASSPPVAPNTAQVFQFAPILVLHVLRPINVARHDDTAADPKLARGPPAFA